MSGGTDDGVELTGWPGSPHEATRYILGHLPECDPVEDFPRQTERPVLPPDVIEGEFFRAIHVADPKTARGTSGFAGFLDGTQDVRVVNQSHGIPIVWATVSAAIRARVNRRLIAWTGHAPIVSRRYYIPFRYVDGLRSELRSHPQVIDTAREDSSGIVPSRHPAALMEAAVQRVQQDRESIELALAEAWCANESTKLFVDGSITGSEVVSASTRAVGVVNS